MSNFKPTHRARDKAEQVMWVEESGDPVTMGRIVVYQDAQGQYGALNSQRFAEKYTSLAGLEIPLEKEEDAVAVARKQLRGAVHELRHGGYSKPQDQVIAEFDEAIYKLIAAVIAATA